MFSLSCFHSLLHLILLAGDGGDDDDDGNDDGGGHSSSHLSASPLTALNTGLCLLWQEVGYKPVWIGSVCAWRRFRRLILSGSAARIDVTTTPRESDQSLTLRSHQPAINFIAIFTGCNTGDVTHVSVVINTIDFTKVSLVDEKY